MEYLDFVGDGYECKTLSEAIKQAYDWARKEEQMERIILKISNVGNEV